MQVAAACIREGADRVGGEAGQKDWVRACSLAGL